MMTKLNEIHMVVYKVKQGLFEAKLKFRFVWPYVYSYSS